MFVCASPVEGRLSNCIAGGPLVASHVRSFQPLRRWTTVTTCRGGKAFGAGGAGDARLPWAAAAAGASGAFAGHGGAATVTTVGRAKGGAGFGACPYCCCRVEAAGAADVCASAAPQHAARSQRQRPAPASPPLSATHSLVL